MDTTELIILLILFTILLVLVIWIFWPGIDKPPVTVTEPATPSTIGEFCNTTTLCDSGLVCETTCRGTTGTKCDGNYQCADELYCVGLVLSTTGDVLKQGICQARPSGGLNQPCPNCDAGFICDESLNPPVCKANEGTECTANDDCFYRVCTSGVCEGGVIPSDPCRTDFMPFVQGTIVSSSRCEEGLICDTTRVETQFGPAGTAGYCQIEGIMNGTDGAFCLAGEPFPQPDNMLQPGCNTGLVCLNGRCEVGQQFWGQTCDVDAVLPTALNTCNPPLVCGVGPGGPTEPTCVYPEFPNTCDITGQCSSGFQCVGQTCIALKDIFCSVDTECTTGSCDTDQTKIWRWTGDAKTDPSTARWQLHSELPASVFFNTFNASNVTLWGVSLQNDPTTDIGVKITTDSGNSVSSALGGIYRYMLPGTRLDRPSWDKVFPYQVIETLVISGSTVTRTTTIKDLTAPNDPLIFEGSPLVVANVKIEFPDTSVVQNDALYLLKKLPQDFVPGTVPERKCVAEALTFGYILVPFNVTPGDVILGSQRTVVPPSTTSEIITTIDDLDVSEQQDVILRGSSDNASDFLFLRTMEIVNYFLREQNVTTPRFYNSAKGCSEFNYSYVRNFSSGGFHIPSSAGDKIIFNGVLTGQELPHPGLTLTSRTYELPTYQHFNVNDHEFVNSASTLMLARSTNVTGTPHNLIMVEGLLQSFSPGYVDEFSRLTAASHGQYVMAKGTCV